MNECIRLHVCSYKIIFLHSKFYRMNVYKYALCITQDANLIKTCILHTVLRSTINSCIINLGFEWVWSESKILTYFCQFVLSIFRYTSVSPVESMIHELLSKKNPSTHWLWKVEILGRNPGVRHFVNSLFISILRIMNSSELWVLPHWQNFSETSS